MLLGSFNFNYFPLEIAQKIVIYGLARAFYYNSEQ